LSDPFSIDDDGLPPPPPVPRAGGLAARALAAARPDAVYLSSLNPEQREAVESADGPVLVLAGAGTGKTRVLTTRIAHIIATGRAYPSQILAVTFTNKAAREMKERIGHLVGAVAEGMPWLGTFHSIGTKMLRRHAELVDLRTDFTILDTDDQLRLMKQLIQAEDIDEKRWPARVLASMIDGWKNRGLTPARVPSAEGQSFANGKGLKLYKDYQARLKTLNACDFGDLLLESIRLLQENPEVLAQFQDRFRYLLVDEYQDTNVAQYLWLRLLAQKKGDRPQNICCVGDDDQCIAAGTHITLPTGQTVPVECVKPGDNVLSAYGSGDMRPARVLRVHRKAHEGEMVRIRLASGRELVSTAEHVHFAGYRLSLTPQSYFVYLMHKRGVGYRIGTTQVHTKGQAKSVVGFKQRALQEHADALWIISVHASENEARLQENLMSLRYGLPQLPFVPRKGRSKNGLVHDAELIARVFAALDTESAAQRLLADVGLSGKEPHHLPQSRNATRRNVTLTLCGDRRGTTPMHRLSIVGNDAAGADALRKLGFSVRRAKEGSTSWRVETAKASWREVMSDVDRMRQAFDVNVIRQARLGNDNAGSGEKASSSLPFIQAKSLRPGMVMFTAQGYDVIADVSTEKKGIDVVDLDVDAFLPSTAGVARRSTISCASRRTSPARKSSASSATTAPPATSSQPPPSSSPITRTGWARRCSPTVTTATR
jgi:UvrD/REP helicase N-terminal domain